MTRKIAKDPCFIFVLMAGCLMIFCTTGLSWAENGKESEKPIEKRFQLEIYGGFSVLNPVDFNLFTEADKQVQDFFYDQMYNKWLGNGYYNRSFNGEFKSIKNAVPIGLRLKYQSSRYLTFSIGYKYFSIKKNEPLSYEYSVSWNSGYGYIDRKNHTRYSLQVSGHGPMIGLQFKTGKDKLVNVGVFAGVGWLFAKCAYLNEWNSELVVLTPNYPGKPGVDNGLLEMKGKGDGLMAEVGGRIDLNLGARLGIFMEIGGEFQSLADIEGPGRSIRGGVESKWQGKWVVAQENVYAWWGSTEFKYPFNHMAGMPGVEYEDDFSLNLSNYQIRLGIFFRF